MQVPLVPGSFNHYQPKKIRYRLMLISSRRYKLITSAIIKRQLIAVNYLDAFALATPGGIRDLIFIVLMIAMQFRGCFSIPLPL
jgi:hypothetical protein